MNGSVFGIMLFFFLTAAILTLVVGNPLQINAAQQVNIQNQANVNIGNVQQTESGNFQPVNQGTNCIGQSPSLCSGDYKCTNTSPNGTTCITTASTGLEGKSGCIAFNTNPASGIINSGTTITSPFGGLVQSLSGIPTLINAGLTQIFDWVAGKGTIAPSPIQCNGIGTTAVTLSSLVGAFTAVGTNAQNAAGFSITNNPQVDGALGIAIVFIGVGLLAGLFGAGILAGVISSVGIILSVIYFIVAEINLPNPQSGLPYFTLPTPVALIFTAFFSVSVIWMLIVSMNK